MQYRLRTLLILLAIGPPLLAGGLLILSWLLWRTTMLRFTLRELIMLTTIVALLCGWAVDRVSLRPLVTQNRQLQMQNDVLRPALHDKQEEIDELQAMRRADLDAYDNFRRHLLFYWGKQRTKDRRAGNGIAIHFESENQTQLEASLPRPTVKP